MKKSDLLQAAGAAAPGISLRTAERMQASAEKEGPNPWKAPGNSFRGKILLMKILPSNVDTGYASGDTSQKGEKRN